MGTNYYAVKGDYAPEADYDHPLHGFVKWGTGKPAMIHIGKSSGGWCFSLHIYPELGVHTLADWKVFAPTLIAEGWRIEDEYRDAITLDELWGVVERVDWERWNGRPLLRADLSYGHCVGHGEGLYDYITGEFS
jgi:hypothetical protein